MTVRISKEFMLDLRNATQPGFVRRVLRHVLDQRGDFIVEARDDHRFDGIKDAWIRYASEGASAYRIIYIKSGNDITLYRAGLHSVEDKLTAPKASDRAIEIVGEAATNSAAETSREEDEGLAYMYGQLLSQRHRITAWQAMHPMFHVKQREIYFVVPFITEALLESKGIIGRFIDRAIEDETCVAIISSLPHTIERFAFFQRLEARGVIVVFCERLHSKLYYFEVDRTKLPHHLRHVSTLAVLGSANLTDAGLCIDGKGNEELCYRVPDARLPDTKAYIDNLLHDGIDIPSFRIKFGGALTNATT